MARSNRKSRNADHITLSETRIKTARGSRRLTTAEEQDLIQMLAAKVDAAELDAMTLAPAGSFLAMTARHFKRTDISYALPIMQTVMIAASWLTQSGACLFVPGVGQIKPTLWLIGLAESGNAKTLASNEISAVLSDGDEPAVQMMPDSGTDAQWIIELFHHNGSFWQQDEVGKRINAILKDRNWARVKPWILDAYSYQPISNRIKSEKEKLEVKSPHFTFHGLSVFSTWKSDIDASSMLDGFCQRFNYYIADQRTETDMYDHFLYFVGDDVEDSRQQIKTTWQALCKQPGAAGEYTLDAEVLPYLTDWWRGLRDTIGKSGLPASFVRRIGFSIIRYLIVIQFLLGKSRLPIDLETAILATKYAEYHMTSALLVIQDYNAGSSSGVQKVAAVRDNIVAAGEEPTARNVSRKLSKSQRADLPGPLVKKIVDVLNKLKSTTDLFEADAPRTQKSAAMSERRRQIDQRLKLNERKRNERRLRNLRSLGTSATTTAISVQDQESADRNVVSILRARAGDDDDPFDMAG